MAKYEGINEVLNKNPMDASQDVAINSSLISRKTDLHGILELLITTNDVHLQIKLFSALSAYLMFNKGTNLDVIIKCSALYDRIHNVLEKGLQQRAAGVLNFLSTLLYVDVEDDGTTNRRTLALYAKNMTRISGCLSAMAEMFTSCMMYHDSWKALCQCIASVCSGCEINQSYCTHLIPVCIQKCNQANIDVCLVLQSLIHNHNRNIQLFLDCNGTAIFTRDLLHYDKCLHLLTTVVQFSSAAPLLLSKTNVPKDLQDFAHLYGPSSQIGQKALIILKNIGSRTREPRSKESFRDILYNNNEKQSMNRNKMNDANSKNELDDTKTLMQNVMKEVFKYKQNDLRQMKKTVAVENKSIRRTSSIHFNTKNKQIPQRNWNKTRTLSIRSQRNKLHRNIPTELSFSFLQNPYNRTRLTSINNHDRNENVAKSNRTELKIDHTDYRKTEELSYIDTTLSDFKTAFDDKPSSVKLKNFKPFFSSTPKRDESFGKIDFSKMTMHKLNNTELSKATQKMATTLQKQRPKNRTRKTEKLLRNTSLGYRFFNAINDSCTTLVKTFTNIFKKNSPDCIRDSTPSNSSHADKNRSCSYSFLKYMEKRDAVLSNNHLKKTNTSPSHFSLKTQSCETCDNTEVLKQKMAKDEHLKQTVKKLKLGINLYGCDFKKISKTMWPRESYMTPVVLYNLYRKLIIK